MPCSDVVKSLCTEVGGSKVLQNVGIPLHQYMASQVLVETQSKFIKVVLKMMPAD
jgi:hypothetical protein